jgi:hypothetical protein
MADLIAALMDLYSRQAYPEVQDPVEIVLESEIPQYDLGVGQDIMRSNLELFADRTALAESSRNPKAEVDAKGKAKGLMQWLTEDPEGEGQPAFQTALNRISKYYDKRGKRIAPWILDAKEHNDPTKLTERQQKALFFADVFQRKGTTTEKGEGYEHGKLQEIMRTGDPDIMNDVYLKHWHTRPNQSVVDNARRSFY